MSHFCCLLFGECVLKVSSVFIRSGQRDSCVKYLSNVSFPLIGIILFPFMVHFLLSFSFSPSLFLSLSLSYPMSLLFLLFLHSFTPDSVVQGWFSSFSCIGTGLAPLSSWVLLKPEFALLSNPKLQTWWRKSPHGPLWCLFSTLVWETA